MMGWPHNRGAKIETILPSYTPPMHIVEGTPDYLYASKKIIKNQPIIQIRKFFQGWQKTWVCFLIIFFQARKKKGFKVNCIVALQGKPDIAT